MNQCIIGDYIYYFICLQENWTLILAMKFPPTEDYIYFIYLPYDVAWNTAAIFMFEFALTSWKCWIS